MANNYLQFSEVLPRLTDAERTWLTAQLESVCVFAGVEYADDAVPAELKSRDPDWRGCRAFRDWPDYEPSFSTDPEFQYQFCDDEPDLDWGRHLWLYSDECGNPDQVAQFVQKFLRQFRPHDCWSLTYSCTCSKPRVGEFGGGAVFVTADEITWQSSHDFIDEQHQAFAKVTEQPGNALALVSAFVISVSDGVVQDVFCSAENTPFILVDWDAAGLDESCHGFVKILDDYGQEEHAQVVRGRASSWSALTDTDIAAAIHAAHIQLEPGRDSDDSTAA